MDEAKFQKLIEPLRKPRHPWPDRFFTLGDLETMTNSQLSELTLEMIKFTAPGSNVLGADLYDLIEYLDEKVAIPEEATLEKNLHMTASLVSLAGFQSFDFNKVPLLPKKLVKHLARIVNFNPLTAPLFLMEGAPSLQIATFLAYPVLEGVIRRKLPEFISKKGIVQREFEVESLNREMRRYKSGKHISSLYDELQLLEKKTTSLSLKKKLSKLKENRKLFREIHKWRNMLMHGELTASWHGLTLLLLTFIILLDA